MKRREMCDIVMKNGTTYHITRAEADRPYEGFLAKPLAIFARDNEAEVLNLLDEIAQILLGQHV